MHRAGTFLDIFRFRCFQLVFETRALLCLRCVGSFNCSVRCSACLVQSFYKHIHFFPVWADCCGNSNSIPARRRILTPLYNFKMEINVVSQMEQNAKVQETEDVHHGQDLFQGGVLISLGLCEARFTIQKKTDASLIVYRNINITVVTIQQLHQESVKLLAETVRRIRNFKNDSLISLIDSWLTSPWPRRC